MKFTVKRKIKIKMTDKERKKLLSALDKMLVEVDEETVPYKKIEAVADFTFDLRNTF